MTSSAGWNSSRTRPSSRPRAWTSASAIAAPTSPVVCTSCPQAWATPGSLRPRLAGGVVDGKGVEVGAQADDRAVVAELGDQPGTVDPLDLEARLDQPVGHDGGPLLRPRQLGVGVEVATEVDQVVAVLLENGFDQTGRGRGHRARALVPRGTGSLGAWAPSGVRTGPASVPMVREVVSVEMRDHLAGGRLLLRPAAPG